MERLLPLIDHLVVSEKFARQADNNPEEALKKLAEYGAEAITITLGKAGSLSRSTDGQTFSQPAFKVDVVDTTGCGDVFHGGYIFGLLQGWPLPQTIRFASACAALKTRALGGRTAIPVLQVVENFLRDQANEST
jgi:ribokinase